MDDIEENHHLGGSFGAPPAGAQLNQFEEFLRQRIVDQGEALNAMGAAIQQLQQQNTVHAVPTAEHGGPGSAPVGTYTPSAEGEPHRRPERQHLPRIEVFEGDKPEKAAAFLNLLQVYFLMNPAAYPTDRVRSLFLIVHLRGPAEVWSRRYTEIDSKFAAQLDNYVGFVREFNGAFGMYTREDTA